MNRIKKFFLNIIFHIIFPIFMLFSCIFGYFFIIWCKKTNRSYNFLIKKWAKSGLYIFELFLGIKLNFKNNVNKNSIIAAQHQSVLDVFGILANVDDCIFLHKKALLYIPFLSQCLKELGMIAIDRSKKNTHWFEAALKHFENGKTIVFFIEGKTVEFNANVPYRHGIFKFSKHLNKKITPIANTNGLFWKKHQIIKNSGTAYLIVGQEDYYDEENLRKKFLILLKDINIDI